MIRRADTVGVFQIESRAQMSMLPRLKPDKFYDLVIEVAIVRPGPIQGGMVHPYLRRKQGKEDVVYPREEIKAALERTLGVPIFQEQVMQIAMIAADFSAGDADQLRRSMAAWKRKGGLEKFQTRIIDGMLKTAIRASLPRPSAARSRALASTVFRRVMRQASHCSPMRVRGSSVMHRRCSCAGCSTVCRWDSIRRRSWCRMRDGIMSRCARSTFA